ncbi:anthranilate phosphoribosyltransferase [Kribbia dieselivorans]|uniref:anthranilate phosphoribosyltransferase n=1 Tax=Kribbia dieselivorans TaxID=331526 RepID=UPI0008382B57|nr:anthranilate phosphoribosyltransferase [Kribbia dieselivorans]
MVTEQTYSWPVVITSLIKGEDLSFEAAAWAMDRIFSGEASPAQVAGFLTTLAAKGETVAELRALADVMLSHARTIDVEGETVDIVGTGGDFHQSVNISSMASVIVAATGRRVVKHGNRAASSKSGSADVLEALGINLTLTPDQVEQVAADAGITFCFAQTFHPAMRHAAEARRDLGVATAFNILGPLTNPARPTYALIGCAKEPVAPIMAGVFADRGSDAVVFRGDDGLDELTIATTSHLWWVAQGAITEHTLAPEDVGLTRHPLETLRGGDAVYNADVARRVWAGETGPIRDAVVLNAGIALALADAKGTPVDDPIVALRAGMDAAEETIDSGAATAQMERWAQVSTALGQ